MPEQVKVTLDANLASTEIHCNDPGRGYRLRRAYWAKHDGEPKQRKRVSPEVRARVMRKFRAIQVGDLMRNLFEAGRLDGFRLRRYT